MLKRSIVLKFNNVEMLKTMLKMLKTNKGRPASENKKLRRALRSAHQRRPHDHLGKVTNYYKEAKTLKKVLTSGIMKSGRKEGVQNETEKLQNRNDKHKNG